MDIPVVLDLSFCSGIAGIVNVVLVVVSLKFNKLLELNCGKKLRNFTTRP